MRYLSGEFAFIFAIIFTTLFKLLVFCFPHPLPKSAPSGVPKDFIVKWIFWLERWPSKRKNMVSRTFPKLKYLVWNVSKQTGVLVNACFGVHVSSKYGTWYSERVILQFMCVGCWAGITYLRYELRSLRAPRRAKLLSTVAILLYRFLSCWCLETFFT